MTNKKTLNDLKNIENKKVIIRVDFNVPIKSGVITDDNRIKAAIPTIEFLLKKNAHVILMSHLGRVKTLDDLKKNDLAPVAVRLQEVLGKTYKVQFVNSNRGPEVESAIKMQKANTIILLQNTRYQDIDSKGTVIKHESKNNAELGKYWASLGDAYVNDAFGTAHRAHASNVGIADNMNKAHKPTVVGFLVEKELTMLSKAVHNPKRPLVAILGGAKVSDKILVIENLLKIADKILIGGGMAFTFMKAQGHMIGNSLLEAEALDKAKEFIKMGKGKLILPVDYAIASEFKDVKPKFTKDQDVADGMIGLDIGPKSIEIFKNEIKNAKTVIWNGPMGVFEMANYATGTKEVCKAISEVKGCYSVIGGGDSAAAAIQLGYQNKFSHISTGGGASLEFFEGKQLPGIEIISSK